MQPFAPPVGRRTSFHKRCQQLSVIFDGVDTQQLPLVEQKNRFHTLDLQSGDKRVSIPADAPLVTYVTRCLEPYRGWPQVAEGLALLMQRNPRAHILLVGSDEVAYGPNVEMVERMGA